MARKFDATLKALLEESPADWPALAGFPFRDVQVIDADISTVSGAADKVLLIPGPPDQIMHFEFQAGPDATLPRRLNVYNGVLEDRHSLPVRSVLILLRPEANLHAVDGWYRQHLPPDAEPYRSFRYQVIRVWELPVGTLLAGGLGTLPLAPISAVREPESPSVIQRMKHRLDRPECEPLADRLWAASYVLMGLRYELSLVKSLLQGVAGMKESVTYQAIIEEGRREGALDEVRKVLLRVGQHQFGAPAPDNVRAILEGIHDLEQLEQLTERVLEVDSWDALLTPPRKRSRRRRNGT